MEVSAQGDIAFAEDGVRYTIFIAAGVWETVFDIGEQKVEDGN